MKSFESVLRTDERITLTLRSLYEEKGYARFKMSKFEEYELYSRNKDFLISDSVITFTDNGGRLMALKPDVTLSIVKNSKDTSALQKVYYDENVYRVNRGTGSFEEIKQVGLEAIGEVDFDCLLEVLTLSCESLKSISKNSILTLSNLDILSDVLENLSASRETAKALITCVGLRSIHEMESICTASGLDRGRADILKGIVLSGGKAEEALKALKGLELTEKSLAALKQLEDLVTALTERGYGDMLFIDFSAVTDVKYYNGTVFNGYIGGIPAEVLSGGQYDKLMQKMHRSSKAVGFAVYLNELNFLDGEEKPKDEKADEMLNIALPKGRLGEKVYAMFEKAGFDCPSIKEQNRKLIFENKEKGLRFFWVKPSDVAIYVERGAADIGVAGKDILLEYEPDIYELLDLDIGKCRMAVAAKKDFCDSRERVLKVATKFSNIARGYYASIGREIDIIHLNGSIEIAPILKLSDVIVDIVETGTTLKENNLEVFETIVPISARLISNKASYRFKFGRINGIINGLSKQIKE